MEDVIEFDTEELILVLLRLVIFVLPRIMFLKKLSHVIDIFAKQIERSVFIFQQFYPYLSNIEKIPRISD